jgi:tetratricopeptide (TPR) repeat protein
VTARERLNQSLEILREIGEKGGHSGYQGHLARVALKEGDLASARRLAEESLIVAQETGHDSAAANVLDVLGRVVLRQGLVASARSYLQQSLRIRRELDYLEGIAAGLESWAQLAVAEGDSEGAVRLISVAEALRQKLGMPLPPVEQPEQTALLQAAHESLGEEALAAAWESGQQMTWQEAAAQALGETAAEET